MLILKEILKLPHHRKFAFPTYAPASKRMISPVITGFLITDKIIVATSIGFKT
jgi:hypothetical protein